MSAIRITFVIGSLALGGTETQLVRLVNNLDRKRFRPSILCLLAGGDLEAALSADVPVIKLGLAGISRDIVRSKVILGVRIFVALVRGLRSQRPDVVHAYLPMAYVLGGLAARLLRVRVIVAGRRGLTSFEIFRDWRGRLLAQWANRVIDIHICNSLAVCQLAVSNEGIPLTKTLVIPNGIDITPLETAPELPAPWRSPGPMVAMIANLIGYKGHRIVLQALPQIVKRYRGFRLVLMGDGPERASLMSLVQNLSLEDAVIFAGSRRDAGSLIPAFDFTVLSSSEEGFPNAVMESMACGIPVVATAVGGVPELIDDGVNGLLVPFGDVGAMANAMEWMIGHPEKRRQMGENARQLISSNFSTARMVTATETVYEELLTRRAALSRAR